ncbi:NUDIX domain-containing protein [archaeon]|nr:NUDIX domain-containing protein [archaeon]
MVVLDYPDKIDKITVGCILVYNGKFLLFHRADNSCWNSIAGNVDEEDPVEAIRRELKEEIGLELAPEFFTTTYHDYAGETVEYNLFAYVFDEDPSDSIVLDPVHSEFKLFSLEEALKLKLFEDEDYCLKLYAESFREDEEF